MRNEVEDRSIHRGSRLSEEKSDNIFKDTKEFVSCPFHSNRDRWDGEVERRSNLRKSKSLKIV